MAICKSPNGLQVIPIVVGSFIVRQFEQPTDWRRNNCSLVAFRPAQGRAFADQKPRLQAPPILIL